MSQRQFYPFRPVRGSPSFTAGSSTVFASTTHALESTSRIWPGPHTRSVRLAENLGIDYRVALGSSDVVAASSDSMLVLGNTVEVFHVEAGLSHIAIASVSTSTGATVNITLGHSG